MFYNLWPRTDLADLERTYGTLSYMNDIDKILLYASLGISVGWIMYCLENMA